MAKKSVSFFNSTQRAFVHEGIDVDYFHPVKQISHDELIFTTRGFEPIKTFEHFTSIVCNLLLKFPNLSLIIVGKDKPATVQF